MLKKLSLTLILLSVSATCAAQSFRVPSVDESRAKKWDLSFNLLRTESESTSGTNGSGLDVDSETGWGFSIAYNLNSRIGLGFDFSSVRPDYTATLVDEDGEVTKISHTLSVSTGQFKGIWNILEGNFTPFVEGGLGWTYIDSNVASEPPITGCWWDPFWGWICGSFFNTYSDTSFSYGGGLGLRWQVTPRFYLRGAYNLLKIDLSSSAGDPQLDSWRVDIGTSF